MTQKFDAIIIGTGQAGPSLAARLTAAGMKTAIIERKKFGGTCVNTGCTPTKALVASARTAHIARRGADFGIQIAGRIAVDMTKVKERKDEIVRQSNEGLARWLKSMEGARVYEGHGMFDGPQAVRVRDELIEAPRIFVNVGARASIPPVPGLDSVPYLDNSKMMEVDFLPEHLVVLGGGYIALEFGQMYRRFGSKVTIIQRGSRILINEDEDVAHGIAGILESEGIEICTNTGDYRVESRGSGIAIQLTCNGKPREITGSHLLVATGRTPNTHDLGLDRTGVQADRRGFIEVDDQLRTNVAGIWALGECNGKGAFTHTAYNDFEIVAANLLDNAPRRVSDRIAAYALYVDPPLGRAGLTERQVRESGREALIATMPMTRIARAREKGETQGFMKVLVDARTERVLGAAILGVGGDEVIHSILDVMYADKPYTLIQRAVHIHPTVSELIPTMLSELKPLPSS
jgi:pyruvate/2-oxoglutarate dehydrogenase complex dihydrolipoamide dehydrogenase (E3) component